MKYKVLKAFRDDFAGIWYSRGDSFETDVARGRALCEAGLLERPRKAPAKAEEKVEEQ